MELKKNSVVAGITKYLITILFCLGISLSFAFGSVWFAAVFLGALIFLMMKYDESIQEKNEVTKKLDYIEKQLIDLKYR